MVVIAAVLRFVHLGQQSLWIDELGEATTAQQPFPHFFEEVRLDFGAAPLDYLGVKVFTALLGHGTVATRAWAFTMGCLGVLLIYVLGTRLTRDRAIGLVAAFMLALSAFDIFYSQEARFYVLPMVVGMLQLLAFLRALDRGRPADWLLYAAATVVMLYSHYFLALLLPIEGIYLAGAQLVMAWRGRARSWSHASWQIGGCLAAQVGAVLALAPWLVFALPRQVSAGYPPLPHLGITRIHQIFVVLVALAPLNSLPPNSLAKLVRTDAVLALAAAGLVWALYRRQMRVLLLAGILALAIPLAWLADDIGHYFWSERQVIFVLIPLYLLAAVAVRELFGLALAVVRRAKATAPGWSRPVALGLAAVFAIGWAAVYWGPIQLVYTDRWVTKEDWRGVAAYLARNGCSDSQYWTFLGEHYSYGFAYYDPALLARAHVLYVLPDGTYDPSTTDAVSRQTMGPNDWLVLNASTTDDQGGAVDQALRAEGWSEVRFDGLVVYNHGSCRP